MDGARCQPLVLSTNDRILILAPHPDDEVIACGGLIQEARARNIPVRVAFFTYGDNNEWSFLLYRKHAVILPSSVRQMGLVRHDEAIRADAALDLGQDSLTFLGYPDFGTLNIWNTHWNKEPPFESMLTRVVKVPYRNAFRYGAEYKGEEVLSDLKSLIRAFKPTAVFASHPADFNPDHRALYLFTRIALWDVEPELSVALHQYLVHFPKWPEPRGDHVNLGLDPPDFLSRQMEWRTLALTNDRIRRKETALALHKSQFEYSAHYLQSFIRTNELFCDLPVLHRSATNELENLERDLRGVRTDAGTADLLTEEERGRFVGIEWQKVRVDERSVTVTIELSRPLGEAVAAVIHVFGYRRDVPFGQMPKIRVDLGHMKHAVYDQSIPLTDSGVEVKRTYNEIRVRIPFSALGVPQHLLLSARTQFGEVPLDWASWRLIDLSQEASKP